MQATNQAAVDVDALVLANDRLCHHFAQKYHRWLRHLDYEDVLQWARIALAESARKWRPDGGSKLSYYASRFIQLKMRTLYRNQERRLSPDLWGEDIDTLPTDCDTDTWLRQQHAAWLCAKLLGRLADRERQIVAMYWGVLGEPQRSFQEIANLLGISKAAAHKVHQRAFARLQEYAEEYRGEWEGE